MKKEQTIKPFKNSSRRKSPVKPAQLYPDVTIFEALNGYEAMAQTLEHLPTMIIADYAMPSMGGLRLLNELSQQPACKGIPIVIATSVESQGNTQAMLTAGAKHVLMKPFNKTEFSSTIKKFIQ